VHLKSLTVATAVATAGLAVATSAEARPYCDADIPCPTPQQNQSAGTATGTVNVNKGYRLTVRKAPRSSARKVRSLANGAQVTIVCQTNGERVTGRYGTSIIWNKLARGGYVSDAYVYTGSDGRVAKDCG